MEKKQPAKRGRPATGKAPMRSFRVSDDEWERWREAAGRRGVGLGDFIRGAVNRAAARVLKK